MDKIKQILNDIDADGTYTALADAVRLHIAKLEEAVACLRSNSTEDIYHSESMPMDDFVAVLEVDVERLENLLLEPDKDQIIADLRAEIEVKDEEIERLGYEVMDANDR